MVENSHDSSAMADSNELNPTRIGKMLRLYIVSEGIRQDTLGKELDISPSTMTRIIKNGKMPDAKSMLKIMAWAVEPSSKDS